MFNEVFTFKKNLFVVFIVKNIDLRVIVELFLVTAKNKFDFLIFKVSLLEVSQVYKLCNSSFSINSSNFKSL